MPRVRLTDAHLLGAWYTHGWKASLLETTATAGVTRVGVTTEVEKVWGFAMLFNSRHVTQQELASPKSLTCFADVNTITYA